MTELQEHTWADDGGAVPADTAQELDLSELRDDGDVLKLDDGRVLKWDCDAAYLAIIVSDLVSELEL